MKKKLSLFTLILILSVPLPIFAFDHLWPITSVDTMKYSRDASRNPAVTEMIPTQVKQAANLGANYIAIDTPYDDQFIPRLTLWVKEARKNNLRVWFRGNFSGWEGWFEYPKLTSAQEHMQKTYRFITQNPNLFADGDIFTPAPEAEAGILGDPGRTRKFDQFNKFLVDSYDNCNKAFGQIKKQVNCGIWSLNPDVVREVLTKETVQKMGGIISVDDYTKSPAKLIDDIEALKKKFDAKVVLGEFGAPIPDINGAMTESEQGQYLADLMNQLYEHPDLIYGLNYWVLNGGSTHLVNDDNSPRPAFVEIQKYYLPITIMGTIKDQFARPLAGVQVETASKLAKTQTDSKGEYTLTIPAKPNQLVFSKNDLLLVEKEISTPLASSQQINLTMEPLNKDWWYLLKLWLFQKFQLTF